MAKTEVISLLCLMTILPNIHAYALLGDIFGDASPCEDICSNTFPLHTYDNAPHLNYCRRGCRLFTILNFLDDFENINQTRESCATSCKEAYSVEDNRDACVMGCNSQVLSSVRNNKMVEPEAPALFPLMFVQNMYSSFVDKIQSHVSVSWSFYMSNNNGQVIIVQSEPQIISEYGEDEPFGEYKTSNYIETNLAAIDNSATPNLKSSQVNPAERRDYLIAGDDSQGVDFLGCISKKTGLPRLLLSFTIFVSALVMIWLCVTTAVTAPEHHIKAQPQKLSIYGDLDYLKNGVDEKSIMAVVRLQEDSDQASPLPIKIKVERI